MTTEIGGHIEPGFERVRDAFANNFEEHGEIGATYAFYVDGTQVVDLWGGERTDTGAPYTATRCRSSSRRPRARRPRARHLLVQRGQLDVDAPVVAYWPEFGQAGKDAHPGALVVEPPGRVADVRRRSSPARRRWRGSR